MNFFRFNFRKIGILLALVIIPLVLLSQKESPGARFLLVKPFSFLMGLILDNYSWLNETIRETTSLYINLIGIKKENQSLRKANAKLQAYISIQTELKTENNRLKKLLEFQQTAPMKLLAVKVIGKDLISDQNTILVNRGSQEGIKRKMAAIAIGGVVGYVIRVYPHTSQILLVTDAYSSIDSLVQRSRVRGITEGTNRNTCLLRYLQRGDDVLKGDLILTSGLNNIFPKGFPIGKVISISEKRKNSISQKIVIQPSINPSKLEEVFIILNVNENSENLKRSQQINEQKTT